MKIKMLKTAAGPDGTFEAGRTYTAPGQLSEERAVALLNAGSADAVKDRAETAAIDPPETPELKPQKKTKRKSGG